MSAIIIPERFETENVRRGRAMSARLLEELRELKRTVKVIEFEERHARRSEVGRARTLAELLMVAKNRGYSPGWAYRIHNARSNRR